MSIRSKLAASSAAVLLLAGLVGCTAQPPSGDPEDGPDTVQPANVDSPGTDSDTGTFMISPGWPWPAALPRPAHTITSEYTGENILGEGGIYTIEFTVPNLAAAQEYADALAAAGISWMMDSTFPDPEPGDPEVSLVAMAGASMATLTVDTDSLHTEFSFIGALE
ncbi:hypothetical protein [Cryobacterium sp. BB307]|uniref:hypothetical protein n=1 Tax=Cryobacterium sp. BB307 TaxID=2716317 RepID=UPI001445BA0B|nr:hypothetical protein [Cryobacterium sp. BB307]